MMDYRFGVEHEFFVLHCSTNAPPSKEVIEQFFLELSQTNKRDFELRDWGHFLDLDVCQGINTATVKCDAFTHIIEVAFSPIREITGFQLLWECCFNAIDDALARVGLKRMSSGALPVEIGNPLYYPSRSDPLNERAKFLRTLPDTNLPFFHPATMPSAASTQISFDKSDIQAPLSKLFGLELFIPLWFSNSDSMLGTKGHCLRPLFLWDYFRQPGILTGIPEEAFRDDDYRSKLPRERGADYSFIADRGDRIEFRTACSQPNLETLIEMIRFRMKVINAAPTLFATWFDDFSFICEQFRTICRDGTHSEELDTFADKYLL